MKYNRLLPILIPFFVLILFEFFLIKPKMIYLAVALSLCLTLFIVRQFIKASANKEEWWKFLFFPMLMIIGAAAYSTIITGKFVVNIIFLFAAVSLYFYFRALYYYLFSPAFSRGLGLEDVLLYGNFFIFFFISSYLYGLEYFLNVPFWPLMIVLAFLSFPAIWGELWFGMTNDQNIFVYIIAACAILLELAWSISFLPINFNITGLILALCYYMIIGVTRLYLLDRLEKKAVKSFLFFGFGGILILLFTARWF